MQSLARSEKTLSLILLVLAAIFLAERPCAAVEIREIYSDTADEGFNDPTPLTQDQIAMLSAHGNTARTLGEARKKAFEYATSTLESRLTNSSIIRIEAKFVFFDGQEDPLNPSQCGQLGNTVVVGFAGPTGYGFRGSRLDVEFDNSDPPIQINSPGLGTGYPYALFEALGHGNLNGQDADIQIKFTKCVDFYYGLTEAPAESNLVDFVQLTIHEIMHGIGFLSLIRSDGSYPTINVDLSGTLKGKNFNNVPARIVLRTIFDEQLYSEADGDTLINITPQKRSLAVTSQTGLLWEGTDGGKNSHSCGVTIAKAVPSSARASDGKPLLHSPARFTEASSVSHLYSTAGDTMEATAPSPRKMELSLGMLSDLGWQVSDLPSGCTPTGTTNNPSPSSSTETEPEPEPELDPNPEPEEELPSPASPDQSGGGAGCALASGKTKDHGQIAPLYLLLGTFAIFTILLRKNRSAKE